MARTWVRDRERERLPDIKSGRENNPGLKGNIMMLIPHRVVHSYYYQVLILFMLLRHKYLLYIQIHTHVKKQILPVSLETFSLSCDLRECAVSE